MLCGGIDSEVEAVEKIYRALRPRGQGGGGHAWLQGRMAGPDAGTGGSVAGTARGIEAAGMTPWQALSGDFFCLPRP